MYVFQDVLSRTIITTHQMTVSRSLHYDSLSKRNTHCVEERVRGCITYSRTSSRRSHSLPTRKRSRRRTTTELWRSSIINQSTEETGGSGGPSDGPPEDDSSSEHSIDVDEGNDPPSGTARRRCVMRPRVVTRGRSTS